MKINFEISFKSFKLRKKSRTDLSVESECDAAELHCTETFFFGAALLTLPLIYSLGFF